MKRDTFSRTVDEALGGLPAPIRKRIEGVPVIVRNRPSRKDLRDADIPPDELLLGLFQGSSLRDRTTWDAPGEMERIILFRAPLEESCATRDELMREIRKTVLHEVGHFLGMREEDLARLGFE